MKNLERATYWVDEHKRYCFSRTFDPAENIVIGVQLLGCIAGVEKFTYVRDVYNLDEEAVAWHIFSIPDVLQSRDISAPAGLSENEIMLNSYISNAGLHITLVLSDNREQSIELYSESFETRTVG